VEPLGGTGVPRIDRDNRMHDARLVKDVGENAGENVISGRRI